MIIGYSYLDQYQILDLNTLAIYFSAEAETRPLHNFTADSKIFNFNARNKLFNFTADSKIFNFNARIR